MSAGSIKSRNSLGIPLLLAAVGLIGAAFWVVGSAADLPGRPKRSDKPLPPYAVLGFQALYSVHCASCHGADGKLGPAPPLNDPLFRTIVPKQTVEQTITAGRSGTPMPGFDAEHGGQLTAAQIEVLADGIKGIRYKIVDEPEATGQHHAKVVEDPAGIAPAWGPPATAPADVPPYAAPHQNNSANESAAKSDEGMAVFRRACAECHGANGEGTENAGAINRPEFLALVSDQLLRRIIITGRPDLGMPDYGSAEFRPEDFKPLTSDEVTALVVQLAQWRQNSKTTSGKQ